MGETHEKWRAKQEFTYLKTKNLRVSVEKGDRRREVR